MYLIERKQLIPGTSKELLIKIWLNLSSIQNTMWDCNGGIHETINVRLLCEYVKETLEKYVPTDDEKKYKTY